MQMVAPDQELDTSRVDVFDCARYDQKICGGTIPYNILQQLQNAATYQKFDLIAGLIENGRKAHLSKLNTQTWGAAPGSLDLTSLPTIISSTPTTGTVGGINAATWPFWRNRQNLGTKTTVAGDNMQSAFRTTWNQCSLGGTQMTPTAIVSDPTSFGIFEGTMVTVLRYVTGDLKSKGDPGFLTAAINFKETPYFFDEVAPAATAYFLNNEVLKFEYLQWMKLWPEVSPANQLGYIMKMSTVGNYVCAARRHLGVVTVIS